MNAKYTREKLEILSQLNTDTEKETKSLVQLFNDNLNNSKLSPI